MGAALARGAAGGLAGAAAVLAATAAASVGRPRATRSSSAQIGTGGSSACSSWAAACVSARADWNASQTTSSCLREFSSCGGNLASTLTQLASPVSSPAWDCQCATSTLSASSAVSASRQGLVDSTSMRCASNTAASRWTCTRCCRSSMTLTRSASWFLNNDSGSRDSGAPALAASRCQAVASAMFSVSADSSCWAFCAHSTPIFSCVSRRRSSSRRSRTARAALLSRTLSSLNTSCNWSCAGCVASQSRTREARSPEVSAENAPPVSASRGCVSEVLARAGFTSGASDMLLRGEREDIFQWNRLSRPQYMGRKNLFCAAGGAVSKELFSLLFAQSPN